MIVELMEESKFGKDPMYSIVVDGKNVQWFVHKKEAEAFYDSILADKSILETKINILKSQEINVSSES